MHVGVLAMANKHIIKYYFSSSFYTHISSFGDLFMPRTSTYHALFFFICKFVTLVKLRNKKVSSVWG